MQTRQSTQRWMPAILIGVLLFLLMGISTFAAGQFVKEGGYYYYYNADGKMATGLTKIGNYYYYFDNNGRQRTSWRQIGSNYYYFKVAHGKKGYMKKSTTIDGITLKKNGKAKLTTAAKRKLKVMVTASNLVDYNTTPTMSKSKKRKIMFEFTKNSFKNFVISELVSSNPNNWDVAYAEFLFANGGGDCYCFAAGFAYFMNAIGYEGVCMEHSGDHAWVRWGDYYYDPHWAESYGSAIAYHIPSSKSGTGGRPHWTAIRIDSLPIDY